MVVASGAPSKLAVTSVNGGSNPTAGTAFSVVVQSQTAGGSAANVTTATNVTLSRATGTGTLGGTLTGTIPAGQSSVTISGVTYTKAESGVSLTATQTSGTAERKRPIKPLRSRRVTTTNRTPSPTNASPIGSPTRAAINRARADNRTAAARTSKTTTVTGAAAAEAADSGSAGVAAIGRATAAAAVTPNCAKTTSFSRLPASSTFWTTTRSCALPVISPARTTSMSR